MIKPKTGVCPECRDKSEKPIIAGRCLFHYWAGKRKPIERSRTPIKKRSDKMRKEDAIYSHKKKEYMKNHPYCEVAGCGNKADDLHHRKGRGIHYTDERYFMAVCRSCHQKFDTHTKWAMENGYVLSRLG